MLGIGIDIVDNERINKSMSNKFIDTILSEQEIKLLKNLKKNKLEFICGRFAAKEAIIKCISDFENPHMKEINVLNNNNGKPIVEFKNYNILLSISHEKNYTIAEAILKGYN